MTYVPPALLLRRLVQCIVAQDRREDQPITVVVPEGCNGCMQGLVEVLCEQVLRQSETVRHHHYDKY
jgi:hypothetical protein